MDSDNEIINFTDDNTISIEQATLMLKYYVIENILNAEGRKHYLIKEASKKKYPHPLTGKIYKFSVRTLYRYVNAYHKYKLNGLTSKTYLNKGRSKAISESIADEILKLKEELPIRSARKIILLLELAGKVSVRTLKVRTVSRLLKNNGYTRKSICASKNLYSKVITTHIYELYMSDIAEIWILDENNNPRKAYLFVVIDVFSRYVVHAQFYLDANLIRLEDCFKKSITKYGLCENLFVDNGKVFTSNHFKLACANLGIRIIYSTVYYPQGRGVIERFNRTFKEDFASELSIHPIRDVRILNDRFFAWLDSYHKRIHSFLDGKSPKEVWDESIKTGTKPKFVSPIQLNECFYHQEKRKVSAYGVIRFESNTYEVAASFVGEYVIVKYDPFNLKELFIYHNSHFVCTAKLIDLNKEKHSDYQSVEKDHKSDPISSIDYTELLGKQFQNLIKEQANNLVQGNIKRIEEKKDDDQPEENSSKNIRPGSFTKEPDFIISMPEFLDVISEFMGVKILSYQQKDLIQKRYEYFKIFNAALLRDTLNNLKTKNPDSIKNIIFYLDEIKNQLD